mmetsp:Transcript_6876/g.12066  ORF Transcript_6876/g.12066 Transcript_6876/m.12066 type:complete len:236 (+) Transcript_6876:143-850(+)
MAKGFPGGAPQVHAQSGHPNGKNMSGFGGVNNSLPSATGGSKSHGSPPARHINTGGVSNMVYLDQKPQLRDGSHTPDFKTELQTAIGEKDMGMLHELLSVVTDKESNALYQVVLNLLKQGQVEENKCVFDALLGFKTIPDFSNEQLANLVFHMIKLDQEELAAHFVKHSKFDNKGFAKALDKAITNEGLHNSKKGDDPLIEQIDRFVDEHMPEVELVYKKHMEDMEMQERINMAE